MKTRLSGPGKILNPKKKNTKMKRGLKNRETRFKIGLETLIPTVTNNSNGLFQVVRIMHTKTLNTKVANWIEIRRGERGRGRVVGDVAYQREGEREGRRRREEEWAVPPPTAAAANWPVNAIFFFFFPRLFRSAPPFVLFFFILFFLFLCFLILFFHSFIIM